MLVPSGTLDITIQLGSVYLCTHSTFSFWQIIEAQPRQPPTMGPRSPGIRRRNYVIRPGF